jgi:hypothetical protein
MGGVCRLLRPVGTPPAGRGNGHPPAVEENGPTQRVIGGNPIVIPEQALLIVEERLGEQQAESIKMLDGMELDELALRTLIAAQTAQIPRLAD